MKFIKPFRTITSTDVALVGGKTASIGTMFNMLSPIGIHVPDGFAITADAYWHFIHENQLMPAIDNYMAQIIDYADVKKIQEIGAAIRALFIGAAIPADLADEMEAAYIHLCQKYKKKNLSIAVRSSATAEDLPTASFAGQQETFLHISGITQLFDACKKCFASLFTDRAIVYRYEKNFDYKSIALSIAVQKMVHADKGVSGVAFSLDTESGFKDVVIINASYGLGEVIVQGRVTPDEYIVFKPTLQNYKPIISKECGSKQIKMVYAKPGIKTIAVPKTLQNQYCMSDDAILELSRAVCSIEDYYTKLRGSWCPMDIEWAIDGSDNTLYILQARPETVHAQQNSLEIKQYNLQNTPPKPLVTGQSIGQQIVSGTARIVDSIDQIDHVQEGDILITNMTDPDWVPVLKKTAAIITQQGGRTCHAAIIARELRIPALVGATDAMKIIKNGMPITLDCAQGSIGMVYEGIISFDVQTTLLTDLPKLPIDLMINLANPERAFSLSFLPVQGIGLARIEFIISHAIKIHPLALLYPERVIDKKISRTIQEITAAYQDKKTFYIEKLAFGIARIAAAFYPKPVIVRFSDFKTNEYGNLLGGSYFEPQEENPMIGFRGAIRYYTDLYKDAFALECAAIKMAREIMGLTNIKTMIPFVRTLDEGKKVIAIMKEHGLEQGNGLEIIMMCEIPSNIILIDEFLKDFDGISIGSNDLTQLMLGVDRDSGLLNGLFDERDPAVKKMLELAVIGAKKANKYSGICGQAPSDYPELADYLIELGIQSISLSPDAVIPFLMRYKK